MKPSRSILFSLILAWASFLLFPARSATATLLNPEGPTYDSHPSAVRLAEGSTWMAWHANHHGRDSVRARRIEAGGSPGPVHPVSDPTVRVNSPPHVAATRDALWVVWSAHTGDNRWEVRVRRFDKRQSQWAPSESISPSGEAALHPTVHGGEDGSELLVAWSGLTAGGFRIRARRWTPNNQWSETESFSGAGAEAFRPVLESTPDGRLLAIWDQYSTDDKSHSVQARVVHPGTGPIERISPPGVDSLTPTALSAPDGLHVAWLQKQDVIGGPGIVSQFHTLHVARRTPRGRWQTITTTEGQSAAAELTHGLMVNVRPGITATGGYLGRRTAPILVLEGEAVWLLWERKADHRASTPNAEGQLLGRRINKSGQWGEPVSLHRGRVDYRAIEGITADTDNQLTLLASKLPRNRRRLCELLAVDLRAATPFTPPDWTGWKPVGLPVKNELPARRTIQIEGAEYHLYWGDFHCHSGLTADAEGEHDELTWYARDRAKLDAVAFTNNDFLYDVPLTEYEFALNTLFARIASRPGRFVSLPGYEWTSRVPGIENAKLDDPANWTPPYGNRSYPNHRSVLYPHSGGPLLRHPEVGNDISVLNAAVQQAGGVTLTQHDRFQPSGHPVEVGMELTSGWGNYIRRRPELFHDPLGKAPRMGFVACGDSHRRAPGLSGALTGLYARELTPDAILDALRQRRCFATSGSRIFIDARANGAFMGAEVLAENGRPSLELRTAGTRPIRSAVLYRNGKIIASFESNQQEAGETRFTHEDSDLPPGTHWYYWEVRQDGEAPLRLPGNNATAHGHLAWSTPHWIRVPE